MKAVIMAGGEGKRLRPLTCDIPKPMARLCGRPVIEHIIDLLSRSGVDEAWVTLRYLPEKVRENFEDGVYSGVKLNFFEESRPLGTAGGVLYAAKNFGGDFIVISGDAMCDFDLQSAAAFHREKQADATIILSRVADPREYGLVVTDASGKVRGFVEKPGWAQAVTDAVNTGIYILGSKALELIPEGEPFDFAKDLFPLMLEKNMKVYGFEADGYWCDIGDIGAYISCQFDMLDGRVDCRFEGSKQGNIYYKSRVPKGNYNIIPPVYIGSGVRIGDYSVIGPFAVLDDGCTVGAGASIKNSVMLRDSYAGDYTELRGALVCAGASLKKKAGMYEGSVLGAGSVIGADASVSPGMRIWPGKTVEDGVRVASNLKEGGLRHGVFSDDGITGEPGADLTPENCAKLGAAAGSVFENGRIGVGCGSTAACKALKDAVAAGVVSTGAEVMDFGVSFESMFNFAVGYFELDVGIFVRESVGKIVMELAAPGGLGIGRATERKIESAVSTGEVIRRSPNEYGEWFSVQGIKSIYRKKLRQAAPKNLKTTLSVRCANRVIQKLIVDILKENGCRVETGKTGDICVHVDATGENAAFICEDGTFINHDESLALGCLAAFEKGEDAALPFSAPGAIDGLAEKYGRRVLRYLECPADNKDAAARELAAKQTFVRDGIENALRILSFVSEKNRSLASVKSSVPKFAVSHSQMNCSVNPGLLLRKFSNAAAMRPAEGVVLTKGGRRIVICPMKKGTGLKISAEASDMETAGELCTDIAQKLRDQENGIDNSNERS